MAGKLGRLKMEKMETWNTTTWALKCGAFFNYPLIHSNQVHKQTRWPYSLSLSLSPSLSLSLPFWVSFSLYRYTAWTCILCIARICMYIYTYIKHTCKHTLAPTRTHSHSHAQDWCCFYYSIRHCDTHAHAHAHIRTHKLNTNTQRTSVLCGKLLRC